MTLHGIEEKSMFAVVKTGGKQYRVTPGDVVVVEKLLGAPGDKIKLDHVLMVGEDGQSPEIGSPLVGNNTVNCIILEQSRSAKILVFKKKRRKGYKRTKGHRQNHTVLLVLDIAPPVNISKAVVPTFKTRALLALSTECFATA